MKRKIIVFLLMLILYSPLVADSEADYYQSTVITIARDHEIDFRIKSTKGWIRLFQNEEKLRERHYKLSLFEKKIILKYLNLKYLAMKNKYSRKIK